VLIAIVGEGAAKQRLVAEASRRNLANIAFLPFQPKAMLANSLTSPDVHLISHKQGLSGFQVPSKLYGILASGRPVIAAVDADSEIAAVVEEAKCGVRVDPGDAPGLARAITEMRQQDLGGMGANGRAALERRFDRHIATSHYAELLEELAVSQAGST
jgi:glycosyltransferase involved in cell wall biosynthesis